jgi:quercetin dioxygenase-like cupin family protein
MARRHTYLRTHALSGAALSFSLSAEDAALRERAMAAKSGRTAKTLIKEGRMRVTLIAMRRGAVLGAHQVGGVVSIHVLRGRARVSVAGTNTELPSGGLLVLQEEVTHTAEALADCALLVTVAMSAY